MRFDNTSVKKIAKTILKRFNLTKRILVMTVLMALLTPIAAPMPAYAYSIRGKSDHDLTLVAASQSLFVGSKNVFQTIFTSFAAFVNPPQIESKEENKSFDKDELEKKVIGFKTELKEENEIAVGDTVSLAVLPIDKNNNVINGLGVKWESSNSSVLEITDDSQAMAKVEGEVSLTVSSKHLKKQFSVRIKKQINLETQSDTAKETTAFLNDPTAEELYVDSLFTFENNLGSPEGQTEMSSPSSASAIGTTERAGSANYGFSLPVASLPGRGLDASLAINYNSRLWVKQSIFNSAVFRFNNDLNWIAPGFSVGYGNLNRHIDSGSSTYRYSVTSSNGTRNELSFKELAGGIKTYESTNGTFIRTSIPVSNEETVANIEVKFANGTKVLYGAEKDINQYGNLGRRYPIKITDRNGNILTITYLANDFLGKIASLRDTLGRHITFHYDNSSSKKLVAVTVPGYNNSTTPRQTIRFYYETISLDAQNRFEDTSTNGTVIVAPATISVLRYVYFPGTQSGYKYYYSPFFGSIYKIEQLRGMQISEDVNSTWSLTQTGTVTNEGIWAASTDYDYPSALVHLNGPLDDVPTYTKRTDDWIGRTTPTYAQTLFNVTENTSTRTTKTTAPDGTIAYSVSNKNSGMVTDNKLVTIENNQEKIWAKSKMFWSLGNNPRLEKVEVTNDVGQVRARSFEYDSYNNPTVIREHDFAAEGSLGTELRRTETTFVTNGNWINNRLLRLPMEIKTIVNNVYVAKIKYEYDNDTLVQLPSIDQTTHTNVSAYRGNPTKVTAFSNATLPSDPNASVTTMKYDVAGNITEAGVNCCNLKTWIFDQSNNYAYPISETRGDTGQLSTSYLYDFNTGRLKELTDENGEVTSYTYDISNLRLVRTDSANGAWKTTDINQTAYPFYVKSTVSLDSTKSVSSWAYSDGRGQVYQGRREIAGGVISNDTVFDLMGRVEKSYNAYKVPTLNDNRPGNIEYSEITERDGLNRTLEVTLADNSTIQTEYDGLVMTTTDQAGKKIKQTLDQLGRIEKVDELDANGVFGNQATLYEYDGNNNLTKTTQMNGVTTQIREFNYDSLSRITHEKQVEATPTLNDAGLLTGNKWTGYYKYNAHGLLEKSVDARGVNANYEYDGLNRVKKISYTGESGYQTPEVTYTYDQARTDSKGNSYKNNGRLTTVKTQSISSSNQNSPETIHAYDYDKLGQIVNHTQTIGNENYNLQYSYNLSGQLISEKYPSGKVFSQSMDDYGTIQTVSDSSETYLTGVTYNDQGFLSELSMGNGTTETYAYNNRSQMVAQNLNRSTEVLQKFEYSYGEVNLNTGVVDSTKNNGQLGKVKSYIDTENQWSQRFSYDQINRLSETREYKTDDNNQLTYKQKFDYDNFGNLYRKAANNPMTGQVNPLPFVAIEDSDISKSTNRFTTNTTYDNAGQVIADNKFRNMNFAYDGNGRRIKTTASNQDASSVYDAMGNRVATKEYDLWSYMIYDAFGKLVAEYGIQSQGTGGVKYLQSDWQGSVRTVTNDNGFVVARNDYQAFGEKIGTGIGLRSIDQGYEIDQIIRQSYGSAENDNASGQIHTWWRKLETMAGRWTRPDPYKGSMEISNPQSLNRYSYVNNNPINFVDPSGLCLFRVVINIADGAGTYGSEDVVSAARAEITRIFTQAGHTVTFASGGSGNAPSNVAGTYVTTIVPSSSGSTLANTRLPGHAPNSASGAVFARRFESIDGAARNDTDRGRGLGRAIAHETVAHAVLGLQNGTGPGRHTSSGLTRASFSNRTLFSAGSNGSYNIPEDIARTLDDLCLPTDIIAPPPDNFAGGGGIERFRAIPTAQNDNLEWRIWMLRWLSDWASRQSQSGYQL